MLFKEMNSEINRSKEWSKFIVIQIIIILLLVTLLLITFLFSAEFALGNLFVWSWISNFCFIWCIYSWVKISKMLITPYIFVITVLFLYSSGQYLLFSLGLRFEKFDLFEIFDHYILLRAVIYSNFCIVLLHLGVLLYKPKQKKEDVLHKIIEDKILKQCILIVLIPLVSLSGLIYFYDAIPMAINSLRYGYLSLYEENSGGETIPILSSLYPLRMMFIPNLLFLSFLLKDKKIIRIATFLLILSTIGLSFIGGSRTDGIVVLICFIVFWHNFIKPYKKNRALLLILIGFLIITIIVPIVDFRNIENKEIKDFYHFYVDSLLNNNAIISIIGELGGSAFPLLNLQLLQPSVYSYKFGESYLAALTAPIPNFLLGDYITSIRVSLAEWLQEILGLDYGPGFSVVAESFYNFGFWGCLIFIPFGIILGYLFNYNYSSKDSIFLFRVLVCIGTLYFTLFVIRDQTLLFLRNEIMGVFIPLISIYILTNLFKSIHEKR